MVLFILQCPGVWCLCTSAWETINGVRDFDRVGGMQDQHFNLCAISPASEIKLVQLKPIFLVWGHTQQFTEYTPGFVLRESFLVRHGGPCGKQGIEPRSIYVRQAPYLVYSPTEPISFFSLGTHNCLLLISPLLCSLLYSATPHALRIYFNTLIVAYEYDIFFSLSFSSTVCL